MSRYSIIEAKKKKLTVMILQGEWEGFTIRIGRFRLTPQKDKVDYDFELLGVPSHKIDMIGKQMSEEQNKSFFAEVRNIAENIMRLRLSAIENASK